MVIFEIFLKKEEILKLKQNGQFFWKGQEVKNGEPLIDDLIFTLKAGPGAVKELVEAVKKSIPNGNLPLSLSHIQEVERVLREALAKFEVGE